MYSFINVHFFAFIAKAQEGLVCTFMLLAMHPYILSSLDIQKFSNYAEHRIEIIVKIMVMHFSILGAMFVFDHMYRRKHMLRWAYVIAYVGAGIYTAERFFSDLQMVEYGGYTLLIDAYYAPFLFFISSAHRPKP